MDDEILTIYCLGDDLLTSVNHHDHPGCLMSSAEAMIVALTATLYFGRNYALARRWLHKPRLTPAMLGKSRFNHRLCRVAHYFMLPFYLLAEVWKDSNDRQICINDTFPVPV